MGSRQRALGALAALSAVVGLLGVLSLDGITAAPTYSAAPLPGPGPEPSSLGPVATFSIVALDPQTGDLGVAVQSRFFAVGAVVPWARSGVGAIATQSWANTTYGPRGLDLLAGGKDAAATLEQLTAADDGAGQRQVGIVGADGSVASHTGDACLPWAGGHTGSGYAVQGNLLAGPEVVDAMSAAFEGSSGELADRLVLALRAGQAAGGDARGRQSAALLVVREGGGYGGFNDRYIDLRVDDHPGPIAELQRLLGTHQGQRAATRAERRLREGDIAAAITAAEAAVSQLPHEGSAWMLLARARLASGDNNGAAAAASQALVRDPWTKSAVLRGIERLPELEQLLQIESFARLWAAVPAGRRP